jgi:hypothetical protein
MKKIIEYINEALKDVDAGIKQMLEFFAQNMSGVQAELFKQKAEDADSIDIVPLNEVFTEQEIQEIKRRLRPQPKMCYENAYKLMDRFSYDGNHEIEYVEGYINMKGFPIEHAFNKVDGKYVDVTIELALGKDPTEDTYVKIGEFDLGTVTEILLQNQYYGQIYETIFLNKYKENVKGAN